MGTGRGGGERTDLSLSLRPKGAEATPELDTEGRKGRKGGSTAETLIRFPPPPAPAVRSPALRGALGAPTPRRCEGRDAKAARAFAGEDSSGGGSGVSV